MSPSWGEFERIADQVPQHLLDPDAVGPHDRRVVDTGHTDLDLARYGIHLAGVHHETHDQRDIGAEQQRSLPVRTLDRSRRSSMILACPTTERWIASISSECRHL
jgi:hypothetical protein